MSTFLLSQLVRPFERAAGEGSAEAQTLTELIRLQHPRTLAELTAPLAAYWAEQPTLSPPRYLVTAIACRRRPIDARSPLAL